MKKLSNAILAASLMAAHGAFGESVCDTYAKSQTTLAPTQEMVAFGNTLTPDQLGLIQTATQIVNPMDAKSPNANLSEFSDVQGGGSSGGKLIYIDVTVDRTVHHVVRVVYYPGDNEYGALFELNTALNRHWASLIGIVTDGDVSCLHFVDVAH